VLSALSLSRYKLPHYIFVVLPWTAVLVAASWERMGRYAALRWFNWVALVGMLATNAYLLSYVFPANWWLWGPILGISALLALYWAWPMRGDVRQVFSANVVLGILVGATLHFHFYPNLLQYQSTYVAGKWLRDHNIPANQVACAGDSGHALDFYAGHIVPYLANQDQVRELHRQHGPLYVYVRGGGKWLLDDAGIRYEVVLPLKHYQVTFLTGKFLDPGTREGVLQDAAIVRMVE
jgi:hypothetical protein